MIRVVQAVSKQRLAQILQSIRRDVDQLLGVLDVALPLFVRLFVVRDVAWWLWRDSVL